MKCPECNTDMAETVGTHAYRSLPGVLLVGIPVWICPKCGEEVIGIPDIDQLNTLLRDMVVNKDGSLTGHEVRFLRKFMEMGKDDLGERLSVSEERIAAWESGQEQIPATIDRHVRDLALRGETKESYPAPSQDAPTKPKSQGIHGKLRFLQRWEPLNDLAAVSV